MMSLIYLNNKDYNEYTKRPGAYVIVENKSKEIAIIRDDANALFFIGGGIENGESNLKTLKREVLEETGYTITNVSYFTEVAEFLTSTEGKNYEVLATVYTANFDKKITEPIEKDHHIMWINPFEYQGKLFRNWQNYVLDIYIKYQNSYDGALSNKILDDKVVFWDIDGTLAPYRFNNHVTASDDSNNGMSIKEIEEGIFINRRPSRFMQNVLKNIKSRKNIIMGHCISEKEIIDKQHWLDIYFPMIEDRILEYENISKADCIVEYCQSNNIDLKDVIFIDDVIKHLREAECKGIESWHISSFLDYKEEEY